MRQDMFKVIVERPRRKVYVGDKSFERTNRRFHRMEDEEEFDDYRSCHESMQRRWLGRKELNENLAPLRRFFESKIGEHWDDVFSEVCAYVDTNSTVKAHVRQHVPDLVALDAVIGRDGKPYHSRWGHAYAIRGLYVHPETGILEDAPEVKRKTNGKIYKGGFVKLSELEYNFKIKGAWFFVRLVKKEDHKSFLSYFTYHDSVLCMYSYRGFSGFEEAQKLVPYSIQHYFAVYKRQLSKKEIRRLDK